EVSLLRDAEYEELVYGRNETGQAYDTGATLSRLFEEQAAQTPDAVAVVYEGMRLSYRELNEKSNQLSRYIRAEYASRVGLEFSAGTLVGLYVDRGLELVIGILGVLKAGGAYVPLDIGSPQDRLDYYLEDTGVELLLTQRKLVEDGLVHLPEDKVVLIDQDAELYVTEQMSNPGSLSGPGDLAYVIYTSGTTGKPKGVMIEHHSVVNTIYALFDVYDVNSITRVTAYTSYVFDVSVSELFASLLQGLELHVLSNTTRLDSAVLSDYIIDNKINLVYLPPVLLGELPVKNYPDLKCIIYAGEPCPKNIAQVWSGKVKLFNYYGPTEASIYATGMQIQTAETEQIGLPIQNVKAYVIDAYGNPVPQGVIGQLHLGGGGLARGYLNRPELTDERFIANPFTSSEDNEKGYNRLYKTGDLVKWLPNGNLMYIGRNDNQIKLRGHRIELGEIENAMMKIDGIRQSCVLLKENQTSSGSNKYLVAYYVSENAGHVLSNDSITDRLLMLLPAYMLPDLLVSVESFPMTANGKIDKANLPEARFTDNHQHGQTYTGLEEKICQIYADVLGVPAAVISIHQNFFRIGGNSILSIKLKQKLNELSEFKHISVADLFKYNTIDKLIQSINKPAESGYTIQDIGVAAFSHEVAIVGMSGAFSGADNLEELWRLIANQQEGIRFYSKEECQQLNVDESLLADPDFVPVAGKVKDIELFDPSFWEISPNEARQLDPQIRKFMEHSWFALESAGYISSDKDVIGVFAGSGASSYFYNHILQGQHADQLNMWEASLANSKDALATKVAFHLNTSGPANSINTACSTSLVAVVEACKNLQLGTCSLALAGGVSFYMPNQVGYIYETGMILSKDGHCNTFDKSASGTTAGSGVGVAVLKRLEDAVRDKDDIIAVIKGYATNNDGARKTGYTAPSLVGQTECIVNAQKMAGISSDELDYVECHGTGTSLGDPIEIRALHDAFQLNRGSENKPAQKVVIGAIKANIGHTDSAAGIAGLLKVCTMLKHQTLTGQVNFDEPNEELQLDQTNFEIIKENRFWTPQAKQRIAGISSFGIGGTNAHIIVGDYDMADDKTRTMTATEIDNSVQYVIPISAKSRQSLEKYQQTLLHYLTKAGEVTTLPSLKDIAFTLQKKRRHFDFRSAYRVASSKELIDKLRLKSPIAIANPESSSRVVFMFPGQGSQYNLMARDLYENVPFFRNEVDAILIIANKYLDIELDQFLYPSDPSISYNIDETQWAQLALFTLEYALAKYLEHTGIKADAYLGHSIGEFVAAALSGVFCLEDAVKLVIKRGQLMQSMALGSMIAVNADLEFLTPMLKEFKCEIAVINTKEDIVLSGETADIFSFKQALDQRAIPAVILNTSHAYHSRSMEVAANKFKEVFRHIKLNVPDKDFISNINGLIAGEEVANPEYWCAQLRSTVQFAKGIHTISARYHHRVTFIEVGPGKGLGSFINKYKKNSGYKTLEAVQLLPSAKEAVSAEKQGIRLSFNEDVLAILWMNGLIAEPNDDALLQSGRLDPTMPVYQFNYQKYWLESSGKKITDDALQLLPKEKWLSAPVWSAVGNLNQDQNTNGFVFDNALIFLREDQLNGFDFSAFAKRSLLVVCSTDYHVATVEEKKLIRINPENELHFQMLIEHLNTHRYLFDTIIHVSSIDNNANFDTALHYSFYSLFLIRQYLLNDLAMKNLLVLTNNLSQITNEDKICAANGTLVGAVRNINHELPNLDARVIDIGLANDTTVSYLLQVYNDTSSGKPEELIAFRFGKLWKQKYDKISPLPPAQHTIADGDIILVTGGLGGVALSLARHIAERHKVIFILVSRNTLDTQGDSEYIKEKKQIINEISANGSSVEVVCADISERLEVSALTDRIKTVYGNLTGIIHTAGVVPLSLSEYSLTNIKTAFKGKVYGIDAIMDYVDITKLKYVVATSSLASIMGDVNRIEYCASNSFLDYLSVDKQRFKRTRFLTINWPGWSDTGMIKADDNDLPDSMSRLQRLQKLMFLNSVKQQEGAGLFYQLINQPGYEQVIISKLDITDLKNKLFSAGKIKTENIRVTLSDEDYSPEELQLAQLFGEVLGLEQLSVRDEFFRLGGNSILAIQLSH
ncbi:MAG: amino acid adenylation domain-containing protein, partial [Mucilaginibacter sp.]|uniref:amino acid adenylation domain-containing protein n=1 Tax=Mucilaginibacter sp. TaxID=1882438 RepID=UPI0031B48DC8